MCTMNPWALSAFGIINNLGLIYQLNQLTKMKDLIAKKKKKKIKNKTS
jgi:hypothetical protein